MSAGDILTLDKPIAPRLIRILYALALVLIALFVVAGVARGIAGMVPGRAMMMIAPPAPQASNSQTAPQAAQPMRPMMGGPRFERRMFAQERFRRGGFMLRRRPSMLVGIVRIVTTLVIGAILLMGVRILAEISIAILAIARRE